MRSIHSRQRETIHQRAYIFEFARPKSDDVVMQNNDKQQYSSTYMKGKSCCGLVRFDHWRSTANTVNIRIYIATQHAAISYHIAHERQPCKFAFMFWSGRWYRSFADRVYFRAVIKTLDSLRQEFYFSIENYQLNAVTRTRKLKLNELSNGCAASTAWFMDSKQRH